MVFWTAGMLLALGLAWFVGAVVVPVWQVRVQLRGIPIESKFEFPASPVAVREVHDLAIQYADLMDMPDRQAEARKISVYLKLPSWSAPEQWKAAMLLRWCGSDGYDVMAKALRHRDPGVRFWAAESASRTSMVAPDELVRALQEARENSSGHVRAAAAEALKKIRGEESKP